MDPVLVQIYQLVLPQAPYVLAAYGILWLGLFGYLFFVARRIGKLEDQLRLVEESTARRAGQA
jgi:CcmD family protein